MEMADSKDLLRLTLGINIPPQPVTTTAVKTEGDFRSARTEDGSCSCDLQTPARIKVERGECSCDIGTLPTTGGCYTRNIKSLFGIVKEEEDDDADFHLTLPAADVDSLSAAFSTPSTTYTAGTSSVRRPVQGALPSTPDAATTATCSSGRWATPSSNWTTPPAYRSSQLSTSPAADPVPPPAARYQNHVPGGYPTDLTPSPLPPYAGLPATPDASSRASPEHWAYAEGWTSRFPHPFTSSGVYYHPADLTQTTAGVVYHRHVTFLRDIQRVSATHPDPWLAHLARCYLGEVARLETLRRQQLAVHAGNPSYWSVVHRYYDVERLVVVEQSRRSLDGYERLLRDAGAATSGAAMAASGFDGSTSSFPWTASAVGASCAARPTSGAAMAASGFDGSTSSSPWTASAVGASCLTRPTSADGSRSSSSPTSTIGGTTRTTMSSSWLRPIFPQSPVHYPSPPCHLRAPGGVLPANLPPSPPPHHGIPSTPDAGHIRTRQGRFDSYTVNTLTAWFDDLNGRRPDDAEVNKMAAEVNRKPLAIRMWLSRVVSETPKVVPEAPKLVPEAPKLVPVAPKVVPLAPKVTPSRLIPRHHTDPEVTQTLEAWYTAHAQSPHPTQEDLEALAEKTGTSHQVVKRWVLRKRMAAKKDYFREYCRREEQRQEEGQAEVMGDERRCH